MIDFVMHSWASAISVAILLGIGLAMDAFGISITHGIKDSKIGLKKTFIIAVVFGFCQGIMPLIGWAIVYGFSSIKSFSYIFSQIVPPLAFVILSAIGVKMIINNFKNKSEIDNGKNENKSFVLVLILQGVATSIDALSSGLAMNDYSFAEVGATICIIGFITFALCILGVYLGKKFGNKAGKYAELIGGIILIVVGTFILIKGEIKINAPQIIPSWLNWLF